MKKNVRGRKKKKNTRYSAILASGFLIALTVLVISWFFSARRTYTVVIMKDGAEQEYAQYHSLAQAKEEMLAQTKRAEKQNAGIRYDHKLIAIGYGVVQFQRKDCTLNTSFRMAETEETGYTNGCYGNDAAFVDISDDGSELRFRQAGVDGWVAADAVTLHNYYDENDVSSINHYTAKSHLLTHNITTNIAGASYANELSMGETGLKDHAYYSYDGHYFYTSFEDMIDDYRKGNHEKAANKEAFYNYYQFLPHRSISRYTADDINWYVENYLGFASASQSLLYNSGAGFVDAQKRYGTNAVMMFSLAMNESDFGRSSIARTKNNLFGHAAYDDSPTQSASGYKSVRDSILTHAQKYLQDSYLNPLSDLYHGGFFGDKASGMNVRYASDPYWGEKAADFYRTFDTVMQGKDNDISYLVSEQPLTIYSTKAKDTVLYKVTAVPASLLVLGQEDGWIKVRSDGPVDHGKLQKNSSTYSLKNSYGFIREDLTNQIRILQ